MVERTNERPGGMFFQAAMFLKENLRSHKATGGILEGLSEGSDEFSRDFAQAETPRDVLSAVSRFGSSEQREVVAMIVDRWANQGNQRNMTVIRQIIRRDYRRWLDALEIESN